jgi:prophage regulatory protein
MKIIRLKRVKELTGLSKSTIYQFIQEGKFPQQIPLGQNSSGWLESEVLEWIQQRIDARSNNKLAA